MTDSTRSTEILLLLELHVVCLVFERCVRDCTLLGGRVNEARNAHSVDKMTTDYECHSPLSGTHPHSVLSPSSAGGPFNDLFDNTPLPSFLRSFVPQFLTASSLLSLTVTTTAEDGDGSPNFWAQLPQIAGRRTDARADGTRTEEDFSFRPRSPTDRPNDGPTLPTPTLPSPSSPWPPRYL